MKKPERNFADFVEASAALDVLSQQLGALITALDHGHDVLHACGVYLDARPFFLYSSAATGHASNIREARSMVDMLVPRVRRVETDQVNQTAPLNLARKLRKLHMALEHCWLQDIDSWCINVLRAFRELDSAKLRRTVDAVAGARVAVFFDELDDVAEDLQHYPVIHRGERLDVPRQLP